MAFEQPEDAYTMLGISNKQINRHARGNKSNPHFTAFSLIPLVLKVRFITPSSSGESKGDSTVDPFL